MSFRWHRTSMFGQNFSIGAYLIASLVVFVDLFDLLLRIYFQRVQVPAASDGGMGPTSVPLDIGVFTPVQMRLHLRPYAILVSVHNIADHLDEFLKYLLPYSSHLWIIDDASSDDTWKRLQWSGLQCVRGERNRLKPGAIKDLLTFLPESVATVVVLDPDVRILDNPGQGISDLERTLFEFQRSGMAALCPRIAIKPDSWLARFQALEYRLSFSLGRKSLADHSITSGIAIYRRDALAAALANHTLSVYAEDLKNAFVLVSKGERIYYDERLVIETEGKEDWGSWFSQRVGWSFGFIKVYFEHFGDLLRTIPRRFVFVYQYVIYMGLFSLVLHPLKLVSLALLMASAAQGVSRMLHLGLMPDLITNDPMYFVLAYAKYTLLTLVCITFETKKSYRDRLWVIAPFYFFYALIQMISTTIGYLNWFSIRSLGRRIYRDHYQTTSSFHGET